MGILSIVKQAKEEFLKDGNYMPRLLLLAKGASNYLTAKLPNFPETQGECAAYLFHAGRKIGSTKPRKEVTCVCLVCTIVGSTSVKIETEVSSDPNHQEFLAILLMDADTSESEQVIYTVQIVRDKAGKVIDLLPNEEPYQHTSPHLPAFWLGYSTAETPMAQLRALHQKHSPFEVKD